MPDFLLIKLSIVCGLVSGWVLEHTSEGRARAHHLHSLRTPRRTPVCLATRPDAIARNAVSDTEMDDFEYLRTFHAVKPIHWN
ncbi:MAG: hypothetical protein Q8922_04390 [Bacteroidota bacterium]|nr:hypothetical protein [Bacteroidota bacterium]MDP4231819.1 hypothetical protein [Bacteroidota bacterium]MDP4242705.1 hypothetical protein [Bacteroidota bacterium]MDP4287156.1 hypothetical protein [Bacteroidota bacterium]